MIYTEPYDMYSRPDDDRDMLIWTHNLHENGSLGNVWAIHWKIERMSRVIKVCARREDAERYIAKRGYETNSNIVIEKVPLEPETL